MIRRTSKGSGFGKSERLTTAYGRIFASVVATGRKASGARAVDLLIAATALAAGLPLYTRNAVDFQTIEDLIDLIAL